MVPSPARRRPFVGMSVSHPHHHHHGQQSSSRKRRSAESSSAAMPADGNHSSSGEKSKRKQPPAAVTLKVRLRRYHGVAAWSWNCSDDVCGICQAAFEGVCPGVKYPGEDCPVVWGKCGHAFHLQCVSKWLQTPAAKNSCPICRQDWEYGNNPVSNSETAAAAATAAGSTGAGAGSFRFPPRETID